ncbi:hypothetical protein OROGR_021497 [Orobanche gracilis]
MALSLLQSRSPASDHHQILQVVGRLERPCLHALCLGVQASTDRRKPTLYADATY